MHIVFQSCNSVRSQSARVKENVGLTARTAVSGSKGNMHRLILDRRTTHGEVAIEQNFHGA